MAATNKRAYQLLAELLAKNLPDETFEETLQHILSKDGIDINALGIADKTILDTAIFLGGQYESKIAILLKFGARTSHDLGVIPIDINDRIWEPYQKNDKFSSVLDFSFNANGDLYNINYLLESLEYLETNGNNICVPRMLYKYKGCVGLLVVNEDTVGTAFLINKNMIMVSRHCLNGFLLEELELRFGDEATIFEIKGVVEDGASFNLDYAVLHLKICINNRFIPELSKDRNVDQWIFIGANAEEEDLYFTNGIIPFSEFERIGDEQSTFQETGFGFSGSPYFDVNDSVYALHKNTGFIKKGATYIASICEHNPDTILNKIMLKSPLKYKISIPTVPFRDFTSSAENEYDEGAYRSQTLGKNPSVEKDTVAVYENALRKGKKTLKNIVCQEVLFRWSTKIHPKARYVGAEANRNKWIADWQNWEISIRKEDEKAREWVSLNAKDGKGHPAIQMGHKISAVSYWVYGANPATNLILQGFFHNYKGKKNLLEKQISYNTRYAQFYTAGFKKVENGESLVNRKFMNMAENYRFEWKDLNEANGRKEKKELSYTKIYDLDPKPTLGELKLYRNARNDKGTSDEIRKELESRKATLDIKIATSSANFLKR